MRGFNWHAVDGYGVLLVECRGCARRAALRKQDCGLNMHQGNMKELRNGQFRCSSCGAKDVRAYFPKEPDDVTLAWLCLLEVRSTYSFVQLPQTCSPLIFLASSPKMQRFGSFAMRDAPTRSRLGERCYPSASQGRTRAEAERSK